MPNERANRLPVVIIVEDEEYIAEALAFLIEDHPCTVRIVRNGKEALVAVAQETPDLVISDFMMPMMKGDELLRTLRAQGYTALPIVLMSAANTDHIEGMGADATLAKPFELDEVEALLRRFLNNDDTSTEE